MKEATATATETAGPNPAPESPAATKTRPFLRGRHLAFAAAGLVHAPLTEVLAPILMSITGARVWSAQIATLDAATLLVFAAFVAWLAFTVFDTHSGVTILPERWRDIGLVFVMWWVGLEVMSISAVWQLPSEHLESAQWWLTAFAPDGDLLFGWALATMFAHAAAEEIVYRGLLLRALEGYMNPRLALFVHAVVFELVHAFIYGYGLTGTRLLAGVLFGWAFQRTRSLAVPTLLHVTHNMMFFTVIWYTTR